MDKKFGIREVVAMGIGTALFVVLTNIQIPLVVVPNTALQPRMAIMAFLAAVFGPVVGAVIGLLGHALGDALFYGSVWWSWVFPEAVVGFAVGFFYKNYGVKEGRFASVRTILLFNVTQIVANAMAWILIAPLLDIMVYAEPANKVFAQGVLAFIGNVVVIGVLGTILLVAYSKIAGKSENLVKED